ncbi:hypothetical protein EYF80_062513 [Liparis tanakae]|uniref:Uncharacterized protein n=1 Tax=Liparis tanakae TaxID=230148 RepID=A0A4Z2EF20_9TELE|nr:hypothetical protein EYF80_062513 [Liparis tanakae]
MTTTTIIIITITIITITIIIIAVLGVLALAVGRVMAYKKRRAKCPLTSDNSSELSEKLDPEPQG